jgi:hypothetical protein
VEGTIIQIKDRELSRIFSVNSHITHFLFTYAFFKEGFSVSEYFFLFFFGARQHIAPDAPQPWAYCAALNFHFSKDSAALCL